MTPERIHELWLEDRGDVAGNFTAAHAFALAIAREARREALERIRELGAERDSATRIAADLSVKCGELEAERAALLACLP